jgi:hypothetical protein
VAVAATPAVAATLAVAATPAVAVAVAATVAATVAVAITVAVAATVAVAVAVAVTWLSGMSTMRLRGSAAHFQGTLATARLCSFLILFTIKIPFF